MGIVDWLPWVRERRTAELEDEIRTHLEMAIADRIARGESPTDAAANARREFGNSSLVQEIARDEWAGGGAAVAAERLVQDVRFALRMLGRAPGFAAVAILTIALGIGATTAVYSVVDATLVHPLPYPRADALVRIEDDLVGLGTRDIGMSTPEWRDLQASGVFEYVSPTWFDNNNLTGSRRAQRVALMIVAPDYFTMLGVKPRLGAGFDPADRTPGFNGQVVISDDLWKRAFGSDPTILGRVVQVDSDSYRIAGVMPEGFSAPARASEQRGAEVWSAFGFAGAPLSQASVESRSSLFPGAIARLKQGLTMAEAQRRIDVLVRSLRRLYPAAYPPRVDWNIRLVPLKDVVVGDVRQPLLFLFGAVLLVLLIGCANVANLLLARATTRGREMALRQALGAARQRLARQLLTESMVFWTLGGIVGLAILLAAHGSLVRLLPADVPRIDDIRINWGVACFALVTTLVAGSLFGVAPALQLRGLDVMRALKLDARRSTSSKQQKHTRHTIVVAELALSLTLISAAGLLVRSFWQLLEAPLGYNPANITVIRTRLPYPNDPSEDLYPTAAAEAPFLREVIRRCRTLAGVRGVALGSGAAVPLDHPEQDQAVWRVRFESDASRDDQPTLVTGSEVTPEYFELLGMTLVRGRSFHDFDTAETPSVAVINESMAKKYWPNEDALGKRLKVSRRATAWTTVVGIVADARTETLATESVPQIYTSLYQQQGKHLAILLRGHFETGAIARAVRDEVQTINSALPVFGARTLDETVAGSLAVRRFSMRLLAIFAVTALLLAALGIYGVVSYMVSERTQEIGLRMALGADRADVMGMIMRQGSRLAVTGVALGMVGALIASRVLSGLLVGVRFGDPLPFAAATGLLIFVALVGCYLPARRAIRVDPIVALRG